MSVSGFGDRDDPVWALFSEVVDLPPDQALGRLERLCPGDPTLVGEVRSLLEWDGRGGGPLDRPLSAHLPPSDLAEAWSMPDTPPAAIGPYQIVSTLGAGGMGVVYLARQLAPVDRMVALKVIRRAVDTDEARRRFALEQQALAIMSHPGIATVFGAGITEDGCPYFAMEYVPGRSLSGHCDEHRLTIAERVEILLKVCGAVHHAHQKGVIHRDLKSSNVLVADTEDGPLPKVIDFGVALASDPMLLPDGRPVTRGADLVGTLEAMSPEQLELGPHEVDTRADIYSLGVLLFELVSGRPPHLFTGEEGLAAIRKVLIDCPPPRLSMVLTGLEPTEFEHVAACRRTTPRGLRGACRPDLESILAKTLATDRELRYSSAAELADDLARWLRGEPIRAHPPRWSYRLTKAVRRHRALTVAALVALASLTLGFGLATRSYLQVKAARMRAAGLLADYRSLADSALLDELRSEADQLWPAWPERIPEMRAWLRRAEALADRRGQHLARLLALGGRETLGDPLHDADIYRRRLADVERVLATFDDFAAGRVGSPSSASGDTDGFLALKRRQVVEERDRLRRRLDIDAADRSPAIGDPWLGGQLAALVQDLDAFAAMSLAPGTPDSMVDRIAAARRIGSEAIATDGSAWDDVAGRIADPAESPVYGGLWLPPQHGLVPLGPDPDSGLWEFMVAGTGEPPAARAEGGYDMTADSALVVVLVPGGSFAMGAQRRDPRRPNYDPRAWQHEAPVHTVRLDPFFVSKYEMTRGQWVRLTGREPALMTPAERLSADELQRHDRLPVDQVYWEESRRVLRHVGLLLPTEAQWEYAARAGTTGPWPFGTDVGALNRYANLRDRSKLIYDRALQGHQVTARYETGLTDGYPELAPVGSFAPNPFGLYDVFGNAAEWCADWFQVFYCPVEPGTGCRVPADDGPKLRVLRGRHYDSLPEAARASSRIHVNPSTAGLGIGLRPVRPIIRTADDLAAYRWQSDDE